MTWKKIVFGVSGSESNVCCFTTLCLLKLPFFPSLERMLTLSEADYVRVLVSLLNAVNFYDWT